MDKQPTKNKNNNKMVSKMNKMPQEDLRKTIKKIFDHYGKKIITKEEFINYLKKQGYTYQQAIQIYNKAAKQKIIASGLVSELDEEGYPINRKIVVEYMTEEDWKIEEDENREIIKQEEIKRMLWEDWESLPEKEKAKRIKEILKQVEQE